MLIVTPNDDDVKKMLAYCGERWRGFKTQLTLDYIKHHKEPPPYEVYSFINLATWKKFVKSRKTPEFFGKEPKIKGKLCPKYLST